MSGPLSLNFISGDVQRTDLDQRSQEQNSGYLNSGKCWRLSDMSYRLPCFDELRFVRHT